MFAFRMFELVGAIQICKQNRKTFPMIFTRKLNKAKHQRLSVDIESTMNTFFPTSLLPKTLSRKFDFCLLMPSNFDEI